jgi:surfactin synthase thioesterase subunit
LTTAAFSLQMIPGDHFFLHASQNALLEIIARQLAPLVRDKA